MITQGEFRSWLEKSKKGCEIVYHTGTSLPPKDECTKDDIKFRQSMIDMSDNRVIHLVQRRIEAFKFAYVAIKRK